MSRVATFKSPRSRKHQDKKRKILFYKVGGATVAFIFVVLVLSFLSRAGFLQVKVVEIEGNKIVQNKAIENVVKEELGTSYIKLFSKNNRILFPKGNVEEKISEKFSAIENVALSFDGFSEVLVKVREYDPEYLWCDSLKRENCYFMDPNGYVFNKAADFSSSVLFTYYGLVDPAEPIGKVYVPTETFTRLNSFIKSLGLLNLDPVGLNARGEDDFELILSSGGKILFSNREDFLTMFENLETIIAEQIRQDKNFLSNFEYIDVRFNTKAFVKIRGASLVDSSEAVE